MNDKVTLPRRARWLEAGKILAVAGVMLAARASLADHYYVPSGSMEPSVAIGDRLLVNKLAYDLRLPGSRISLWHRADPARGDVAILAAPDSDLTLVKRVVAVPGDVVQVRDGQVSLGGVPAQIRQPAAGRFPIEDLPGHSHTISLDSGGGPDFGPVRVPAGHYLVMGDNRGNSRDGRAFGFVPRDRLLGRVEGLFVHQDRLTWLGEI